ncbi:MAG: flagellar motor switch protein FliN [Parvibaculum sp.]
MANQDDGIDLPDLTGQDADDMNEDAGHLPVETADDDDITRTATDLAAVFDVPVNVSAVLGKTEIEISHLLKLEAGTVVELDRKVGEAIDIFVNDRLVARGEVVIVDEQLGVTMTEIIKSSAN